MITFNPGPSQISEQTKDFMRQFIDEDIGSISHRSKQFTQMSLSLRDGLKKYLGIPKGYKIFYLASASEAMEVIVRSCVLQESYHCYNGAFSKKFYQVAKQLGKHPIKAELPLGKGDFSFDVPDSSELICITENETSTGVQIPGEVISQVRARYPEKLLCVDITSSAGGVKHHIPDADIWFFSVQKCFGLPSGLGILIVNERAIKKSEEVFAVTKDIGAIHSFPSMMKKYDEGQTDETPNVYDIFLLDKQLQLLNTKGIETVEQETLEKFGYIEQKIAELGLTPFVEDTRYRSKTTYVFTCELAKQEVIKGKLKTQNITIGSGYGDIKDTTLRIANFPSISMSDLKKLFQAIQ